MVRRRVAGSCCCWRYVAAVTDPLELDAHAAMDVALEEARRRRANGEVPVGAVVLVDGRIVAQAGNERERRADPTAHAEVLALRSAAAGARHVATRRRHAGRHPRAVPDVRRRAARGARVARVVFGAANTDNGACGTLYNLCVDPRLNHEVEVVPGVGPRRLPRSSTASSPPAAALQRLSVAREPPGNVVDGELPERTNGTVSKTVVAFGSPWVRIPRSPPTRPCSGAGARA